ncbi:MAG: amylo-alpha-1,6-glucosidase [bacterium]|nr:amylo-alpha-1,6-glucosidase [bacterium]
MEEKLFLLTNNKGNYIALGNPEFSNFLGAFNFLPEKWILYKTIENISLDLFPENIINNYDSIERTSGKTGEKFCYKENDLIYEVTNYTGYINIDLDFREIYDFDDTNRIYEITRENDNLKILYKKDGKSLTINGVKEYINIGQWVKKEYPYDRERNGKYEFYIYKALKIKVHNNIKLFFTFNDTTYKQDACDTLAYKQDACDTLTYKQDACDTLAYKQDACDTLVTQSASGRSSLSNETNALLSLIMDTPAGIGIFAGFPWFFQFWARDELISTGGLIAAGKYELAKSILSRYLNSILEDGRLSNWYAPSPPSLGSADAIGWLFQRLLLLLKTLNSKHSLNKYFSKKELTEIEKKLCNSVDNIYRNYGQTGLIRNNKKETWMDTIPRAGYRIEIQALQLSMLKAINYISTLTKTNTSKYIKMGQELKKEVKRKFFVNGMLYDGIDEFENLDTTIRPNIFIACYLYPELLTKNEWKSVFSETLKKLWLEWGGLSTIDTNNPLYCDKYTGQDDKSYHNGDSWFFINNLAAISMYRIDKVHFNTYIKDILKASTTEMLSYGFIGHCAELSSAKELNPCGCLAQAWSSATLVELTSEVKNGNIKIK